MSTFRSRRELRELRPQMPECRHSPYAMVYDEDRAQCRECGFCWAMAWRPGGWRVGWKPAGVEED